MRCEVKEAVCGTGYTGYNILITSIFIMIFSFKTCSGSELSHFVYYRGTINVERAVMKNCILVFVLRYECGISDLKKQRHGKIMRNVVWQKIKLLRIRLRLIGKQQP